VHGERVPDFVNGEEHLLLASRQGAGAFQVLACSGGIQVAKQDFAAAARLPALPGCAKDSDVAAICDRYVILHGTYAGTSGTVHVPRGSGGSEGIPIIAVFDTRCVLCD